MESILVAKRFGEGRASLEFRNRSQADGETVSPSDSEPSLLATCAQGIEDIRGTISDLA
jgi:hypothetical protein